MKNNFWDRLIYTSVAVIIILIGFKILYNSNSEFKGFVNIVAQESCFISGKCGKNKGGG